MCEKKYQIKLKVFQRKLDYKNLSQIQKTNMTSKGVLQESTICKN